MPYPAAAQTTTTPLRKNRSFLLFWAGQTISLTGSSLAMLAMPLLVLQATGSVARMGLVTALMAAGSVLAGIISGVLVDRYNRRLVMLCCDTCSAVLYAAIPFCWWLAGPQVVLLLALAIPLGFLSVSSSVAATASIPRLVDQDQITQANARFQMSLALSIFAGPLLAGALAPVTGVPILMGLNALSFLVSAFSLLVIRLHPAPEESDLLASTGARGEMLAGARFLLRDTRVRAVVALRLGVLILMSGSFDLVIFRLSHELHQGALLVGLVWGSGALGDIAAGLLSPRLRQRLGFGICFLGGQGILGMCIIIIALNASVVVFLLLGLLLSFGDILAQVNASSLLQEVTPDALQGRVTAAVQTFLYAGTAAGAAASTFLAGELGRTPPVFLLMGLLILLVSALGVLTPARLRSPERLKGGQQLLV